MIEVRNLADDTWLGDGGMFHTGNTRVIERLTRQGNTLTWQATVEDPEVLAEPWKLNPRTLTLRHDDEIEEAAFCEDRDMPLKQDSVSPERTLARLKAQRNHKSQMLCLAPHYLSEDT